MGKTALRHTVGEWAGMQLLHTVVEACIVDVDTQEYWIEFDIDGTDRAIVHGNLSAGEGQS